MEERRERRAGAGCAVGLVTLLFGFLLGVWFTLGALGVEPGVLIGRVTDRERAPVVQVVATATPRPVAVAGAAEGRRFVSRQPIALDTDTRTPDLLVVSRNYDQNVSTLAYMSPDAGSVRWESAPLSTKNDEYTWQVAYGDEQVFVALQSRLVGLSRATGEQLWEAPLTDSLATICRDCLQLFGDTVVALSQDGELQAFAAATGAPRWNVRLRQDARQLVDAGGLVGVHDARSDGESGAELRRFSPTDGTEAEAVVLECRNRESDYTTPAYPYDEIGRDPQGRFLLWLIDSNPLCLLNVDAASGKVLGRTYLDGLQQVDLEPERMLWRGDTLYLSDGAQIVAVGSQEVRPVIASEEYALEPLAADGDTLVVLAQRTRGSSRYELWAVDAQRGERLWERVLVANDPFTGGSDLGTFTAAVVGDALALVEAHEEPEELRYELIGLRDGVSRARAALGVEDPTDDVRGAIWGRDRLMLVADELYTVELATGQVTARWP